MITGTGTCTLTASWLGTTNYAAAVLTQSTNATKDNSITAITANSPNPSVAGQPVTVSFSVASAVALTGGAAGPTGTVTVSGGGQSCTGALSAGSGSCSLTFPSAGSISLTAIFSGDANFNTSTSAAVTQQVRDFSIVYKAPTSQSVNGNQKATNTVTLTSLSNFSGTVGLGCGGNYPRHSPVL